MSQQGQTIAVSPRVDAGSRLAPTHGSALVSCCRCGATPTLRHRKSWCRYECPSCDGLDRKIWMPTPALAKKEWAWANAPADKHNSNVVPNK